MSESSEESLHLFVEPRRIWREALWTVVFLALTFAIERAFPYEEQEGLMAWIVVGPFWFTVSWAIWIAYWGATSWHRLRFPLVSLEDGVLSVRLAAWPWKLLPIPVAEVSEVKGGWFPHVRAGSAMFWIGHLSMPDFVRLKRAIDSTRLR